MKNQELLNKLFRSLLVLGLAVFASGVLTSCDQMSGAQEAEIGELLDETPEWINKRVKVQGIVLDHLIPDDRYAKPRFVLRDVDVLEDEIVVIPTDNSELPSRGKSVTVVGEVDVQPGSDGGVVPIIRQVAATDMRIIALSAVMAVLVIVFVALLILWSRDSKKSPAGAGAAPPPLPSSSAQPVAAAAAPSGAAQVSQPAPPPSGPVEKDIRKVTAVSDVPWLRVPTPKYRGYLEVEAGAHKGLRIPINDDVVRIGRFYGEARKPYDICLKDEYVSDVHAEIAFNFNGNRELMIKNVSAHNREFVVDDKVLQSGQSLELKEGNRIAFGGPMVIMRYHSSALPQN